MTAEGKLQRAVIAAARDLPLERIEELAGRFEGCHGHEHARAVSADAAPANAHVQATLSSLLSAWHDAPDLPGSAMALALRSAAASFREARDAQTVDVVWTGPTSHGVPVRRTREVLIDVIGEAREELLMVSFAAYKVRVVLDALAAALARQVAVDLVLESEADSDGKLSHDAATAFADLAGAGLWTWPAEARPRLEKGTAVLHAKLAVADRRVAFVTSANLTGHGLTENIELGLLITGGPEPERMAEHVRALMARRVLRKTMPA